ncbi:MAG: hypothetical protein EAS52_05055 [Parapedobacter sp.]|nr:MAG: hypothetical protein EAS52_05055 [Parapedobacter sp.]
MNDILKQINLRLSSPFVFSFCVAWVFINWRIVIGLFWYSGETISLFGYKSHYCLIHSNISFCRNLLFPVLSAIGYMAVVPGVNFVNAIYTTWVKKWQSRNVLKMAGNAYITYSKYSRMVKKTSERELQLSNMIETEESKHSELIEENKRLTNIISENSINNATDIKLSRSESLNGRWSAKRIEKLGVRINSMKPDLMNLETDILIKNNAIIDSTSNEKLATINGYLYAPHSLQVGIQFKILDGKDFLNLKTDEWQVFIPKIENGEIQNLSHVFIESFEITRVADL